MSKLPYIFFSRGGYYWGCVFQRGGVLILIRRLCFFSEGRGTNFDKGVCFSEGEGSFF